MSEPNKLKSETDAEDQVALAAIDAVVAYLEKTFIVEGCRVHPAIGCASCQSIDVQRQLLIIAATIRENNAEATHI